MNKHFSEFWGNFLLNAADSQKQFDCLAQWVSQGVKGVEDLTTLMRKNFGLEQTEFDLAYTGIWKKTQEDLKGSFIDYLSLLGVVPRDEYLSLAGRYEELKEKLTSYQETVEELKTKLSEAKEASQLEVTRQVEELLKKQGEQIQKLEAKEAGQLEAVSRFDDLLKKQNELSRKQEEREARQLEVNKKLEELLQRQNEQYQKLAAKEAGQLEVAKQLDDLLKKQNKQLQKMEARETSQLEVGKQYDSLLKKQSEQFQKAMDSFSELIRQVSNESETTG